MERGGNRAMFADRLEGKPEPIRQPPSPSASFDEFQTGFHFVSIPTNTTTHTYECTHTHTKPSPGLSSFLSLPSFSPLSPIATHHQYPLTPQLLCNPPLSAHTHTNLSFTPSALLWKPSLQKPASLTCH